MKQLRKNLKWKSVLSVISSLIMCICILAAFSVNAFADADENTKQAGEGLVKINVYYTDKNGNTDIIKSGTGFFIDAGTVLTARSVIGVTASEAEGLDSVHPGIADNYNSQSKFSYKIYIKDREYSSNVSYDSETKSFSVLTYDNSTVNDQPVVPLGDSSSLSSTSEEKSVLSLGFKNSDFKDYKTMNGIIKEINSYNFSGSTSVSCLYHDARFTGDSSVYYIGGPLLDSNGVVIGLNTGYYTGDENKYAVAVSINEIKADLDTFDDMNYVNSGEQITSDTPSDMADDEYSEELPDESSEEDLISDESEPGIESEEETIAMASLDDEDFESDDEEEGFFASNWKIIAVAAGGIVVVLAAVVIIIAVSGKKKNDGPITSTGGFIPPQDAPFAGGQNSGMSQSPFGMNNQGSMPTSVIPPSGTATVVTDAGATTVLGGEAGATTVLGQQTPEASLIRKSTGETKPVTGTQFIIGKDSKQANYIITNNGSVSRTHCRITCANGTFSVCDLNSTNGTFLNDIRLSPRQETPLNSGDKLKVSDEEFTFIIK
ncbi:MAG: FHA domain-containing protein [Porcipelethomonas sp.]